MLLFSIRQVAVGLDHQVDILFHLCPFQDGFLVVRVTLEFQSFPIMIYKTAAAVQKVVRMSTDAVLMCQCFGAEFAVRLRLVQFDDPLLAILETGTMLAQFVFNFSL